MTPEQGALQAYLASNPALKCELVAALPVPNRPLAPADALPPKPGRPERPELVHPRCVPRRRLGTEPGRAALVHAVAHIEFNAINLALDAALRFGDMPVEFYRDWLHVARDEARHFGLLSGRLAELGLAYGDLPAHDGLWEMAEKTAGDALLRMALVPRVLEARGLDVTPTMIERLEAAGDSATADILRIILHEEVSHVAIGGRWFSQLCAERQLDPQQTFMDLLREHLPDRSRAGPFNLAARQLAGFGSRELEFLGAD